MSPIVVVVRTDSEGSSQSSSTRASDICAQKSSGMHMRPESSSERYCIKPPAPDQRHGCSHVGYMKPVKVLERKI